VQASYTWSHAFDDVSNGGVFYYNPTSSQGYQVNPFGLVCNHYGNEHYDIRHSFNAAYVWAMPFRFHGRVLNQALAGWAGIAELLCPDGLAAPP
jgi:hypothetical protein